MSSLESQKDLQRFRNIQVELVATDKNDLMLTLVQYSQCQNSPNKS